MGAHHMQQKLVLSIELEEYIIFESCQFWQIFFDLQLMCGQMKR